MIEVCAENEAQRTLGAACWRPPQAVLKLASSPHSGSGSSSCAKGDTWLPSNPPAACCQPHILSSSEEEGLFCTLGFLCTHVLKMHSQLVVLKQCL